MSFLRALLKPGEKGKKKNNHPGNISRNVNDICPFPSICDTNEVLGARSRAVYRLTIRDSQGSLDGQAQIGGGSIKRKAKKSETGALAL